MPDSFMPSVVVEIAFDSGYTTPPASRTWTDVSDYVELADRIAIGVGRQDERTNADANSLTLTLDNTDGRFTAQRAASPYYPNVKIGRPIRVTSSTPGNLFYRFTGFVDQWPVEWDGSDRYAKATITASSRLARLGLSTQLLSMPEETIRETNPGPSRYWTMGDPSGSDVALESMGSANDDLVRSQEDPSNPGTPVVFGEATGPTTDGMTAAEFGLYVSGQPAPERLFAEFSPFLPVGPMSIHAAVRVVGTPPFADDGYIVNGNGVTLWIGSSAAEIRGIATTGPSIADGQTHSVFWTNDSVNEKLYLDGVLIDTETGLERGPIERFFIASRANIVLAHLAIWQHVVPADEIAAIAEAMLGGFAGERTDERLRRILGWAGVTTGIDAETGVETMTYQKTSGQSVIDALRDVESTESGLLFDAPDGSVTFHNRSHRYLSTAAVTLNMASQHVGSDYAPKLDRSTLVNDATVENPTTGESARVVDTDSRDEYGVAATAATSVASTRDALSQKAAWLIASYAEPRNRVPSLTVDVLAHQGLTPSTNDLLGVDVGDLITVTNAPAQADATTASYFVEGYTEVIGPESYEITFNLSPANPTLNTFVIGDPVRGQLDAGNMLAY